MNSNKEWSNLVRTVRAGLGLPQEQFASRLGVTFASVNRWESADGGGFLREFFRQGPSEGASAGGPVSQMNADSSTINAGNLPSENEVCDE